MHIQLRPLDEQVVVITGSSSGIGLVTAKQAARRGARVVLAARNGEALRQAVEDIRRSGGRATYVEADVADSLQVQRIADAAIGEFGRIDTWVNNAAVSMYGRTMELSIEDMRRQMDVNYWGQVYGSRVAVTHLRERGGALINVGSAVCDRAIPLQGNYCAAKHALKAFTDVLRMDLEEEGLPISVTLVKPASIDTPFFEKARTYMGVEPQPVPPVYAPEVAADVILHAAQHPLRELIAGGAGAKLSAARFAPRLADLYMERWAFDSQLTRMATNGRADNLYEPVADDGGERGRNWKGHTRRTSIYTEAFLHPRAAAFIAAAAACTAIVIGASRRRAARAVVGSFMILVVALSAAGCASAARLPVSAGTGPTPVLPAPKTSLIPMVHVVDAKGWPPGAKPTSVAGTIVTPFAQGLDHPRWIYVLPNGDVLVAETNAPPRPDDNKGIKGWFFKRFQKKAGGAVPSANRITLLRDADGDGIAETRSVLVKGLTSPFGMALVGKALYVANSDAVVRVPYAEGQTEISAAPVKVVDLPGGRLNHHWTKSLVASPDGTKLYAGVGSNSNVAEHGMEKEEGRAAIWEIDLQTGSHRIFASGLRNPVGMAWVTETGALWTAVNERDELGSDLVPDYMTSVRDGGFYGWPYSYFGAHVDKRVKPPRPDLVAKAIVPDYALGPHTASLGLAYASGTSLSPVFDRGMFVGQHGSWNRKPRSGYRVIFVPFIDGKPSGQPIDVLTGFVLENGDAMGRPVGVAIDKRGGLLVADDVGNAIWRVSITRGSTAKRPR